MSDTTAQTSVVGRCLCGGVRFQLAGTVRDRRWHGHVGAYINVERTALKFTDDGTLKWYASSSFAKRGFCSGCGSVLFWDAPERDTISVTAGCLDSPTGLAIEVQIFTEDQGDYYALDPRIPIRPKAG
jgi:hypothetical protein